MLSLTYKHTAVKRTIKGPKFVVHFDDNGSTGGSGDLPTY